SLYSIPYCSIQKIKEAFLFVHYLSLPRTARNYLMERESIMPCGDTHPLIHTLIFSAQSERATIVDMSKKVLLGIIIAIVVIGGVYYLGSGPQPVVDTMPEDTTGGMQENTQAAPQTGTSGSQSSQTQNPTTSQGGATRADVDAAASAISAGDQAEATQANSENGTESATQLNSTLDNQSVYAE
ncbi:MAG TPA: hypothetical protein VI483_00870, partial [Candidatus Paceibacterota bacterium]